MSYIIETNGYVDPHEIDERIGELITEIGTGTPGNEDTHEQVELAELRAFKSEVVGRVGDWATATIVAEADFEDHARDYISEQIGDSIELVDTHVDWAAVADALKMDYARIEFEDETYLAR
jgi:hypothetical protein